MTSEEKLNKAAYLLGLCSGVIDGSVAALAQLDYVIGPVTKGHIDLIKKGINELFYDEAKE